MNPKLYTTLLIANTLPLRSACAVTTPPDATETNFPDSSSLVGHSENHHKSKENELLAAECHCSTCYDEICCPSQEVTCSVWIAVFVPALGPAGCCYWEWDLLYTDGTRRCAAISLPVVFVDLIFSGHVKKNGSSNPYLRISWDFQLLTIREGCW